MDVDKLKEFIKSRRTEAIELRTGKYRHNDKLNKALREENARAFEWICYLLEKEFPELK